MGGQCSSRQSAAFCSMSRYIYSYRFGVQCVVLTLFQSACASLLCLFSVSLCFVVFVAQSLPLSSLSLCRCLAVCCVVSSVCVLSVCVGRWLARWPCFSVTTDGTNSRRRRERQHGSEVGGVEGRTGEAGLVMSGSKLGAVLHMLHASRAWCGVGQVWWYEQAGLFGCTKVLLQVGDMQSKVCLLHMCSQKAM